MSGESEQSIYKAEKISKAIDTIRGEIVKMKNEELIAKYQPEIDEVMKARSVGGFESSGDIPEKGKQLLASVYARCRRDGGDKEKCASIAWGVVNREILNKSETKILKQLHSILKDIKAERII